MFMQNDMIAVMNFQDLHERLRQEMLRRIERGDLTGTALARDTGFRQGHISNYLRGRRSLSQQGLDRVLTAQLLTVDQLMEQSQPLELSAAAEADSAEQGVPVVSPSAAMDEPQIRPAMAVETLHISRSRLDGSRPQPAPGRAQWQRFVALRADGAQAAAMDPVIPAGATVVVDRHYNSLAPHRAQQRNLYAVRTGASLLLRYVDLDVGMLILRPLAAGFPVQLVALGPRDRPEDAIVGRVCLVLAEI